MQTERICDSSNSEMICELLFSFLFCLFVHYIIHNYAQVSVVPHTEYLGFLIVHLGICQLLNKRVSFCRNNILN